MVAPAIKIRNRFHLGAASIPPGSPSSVSPLGRTKPPNGIQLSVTSVPFQVKSFARRGG